MKLVRILNALNLWNKGVFVKYIKICTIIFATFYKNIVFKVGAVCLMPLFGRRLVIIKNDQIWISINIHNICKKLNLINTIWLKM
jgi:hypothetical protein